MTILPLPTVRLMEVDPNGEAEPVAGPVSFGSAPSGSPFQPKVFRFKADYPGVSSLKVWADKPDQALEVVGTIAEEFPKEAAQLPKFPASEDKGIELGPLAPNQSSKLLVVSINQIDFAKPKSYSFSLRYSYVVPF